MRLLLINPKRIGGYIVQPPLGLGYLARIANKYCSSVELWDMGLGNLFYKQKLNELSKSSHDVVGISVFSSDINETNRLINIIRTYNSKAKILIGGPHPTAVKGMIFNHVPLADYAFCGDGELGFSEFLIRMTSGDENYNGIPGLVYRCVNGDVVLNSECEVEKLDNIEFPSWELMQPSKYPFAPHGAFYKNYPFAPIIFSRGCPMTCTFCLGANHKPRTRSIGNIKNEIKLLVDKYGVKELLVEDENITIHKNLLNEFCDFMISEYNGKLTWQCPSGVRVDTLNSENIKLMKAAGCHSLSVGIEFGTDKMHIATKKKLRLSMIKEKLYLIKSVGGINITGFFMMGFPQETLQDIEDTINFARTLPIQRAQFNCFMPQPGTEIFNQYCFDDINYDKYHVHSISYKHPCISKRELTALKRRAYLGFYLRPSIMLSAIKQIHTPSHFYYLIKRFYNSIL